jgi:hypothetical protein
MHDTYMIHDYLFFYYQVTGSNKGIGFAIVRGLCKSFSGDVYLTGKLLSVFTLLLSNATCIIFLEK